MTRTYERHLEQHLRQANELVFLLAQRLGGNVEITEHELVSMDPRNRLAVERNPDGSVAVQCVKPPAALQVHAVVQAKIGAQTFDLGECDLTSVDDPRLSALLRSLADEIESKEETDSDG